VPAGTVHAVKPSACKCTNCGKNVNVNDYTQVRPAPQLWPAAESSRCETYYSLYLLRLLWAYEQAHPSVGIETHITAVQHLHGMHTSIHSPHLRVTGMRRDTLTAAYTRWKRHSFLQERLAGVQHEVCPCCTTGNTRVLHCDGNMKLYRYSTAAPKASKRETTDWYGSIFDGLDGDVLSARQHAAKDARNAKDVPGGCPNLFRASEEKSSKRRACDEHGVIVASCEHDVSLYALPIYRGECYEYYLHVFNQFVRKLAPKFLSVDIVCQLWPWFIKYFNEHEPGVVQSTVAEGLAKAAAADCTISGVSPLLGALHSLAHRLECRIVYGTRMNSLGAYNYGESSEHVNSRLASLCNIVRVGSKRTWRSRITEVLHSVNVHKQKNMLAYLKRRQKALRGMLAFQQQELEIARSAAARVTHCDVTDTLIETWRSRIRAHGIGAVGHRDTSAAFNDKLIQLYNCTVEHNRLERAIAAGNSNARSLLHTRGEDNLFCSKTDQELVIMRDKEFARMSMLRADIRRLHPTRFEDNSDPVMDTAAIQAAADHEFQLGLKNIALLIVERAYVQDRRLRAKSSNDNMFSNKFTNIQKKLDAALDVLRKIRPLCSEQLSNLTLPNSAAEVKTVDQLPSLVSLVTEDVEDMGMFAHVAMPCIDASMRVSQLAKSLLDVDSDAAAWHEFNSASSTRCAAAAKAFELSTVFIPKFKGLVAPFFFECLQRLLSAKDTWCNVQLICKHAATLPAWMTACSTNEELYACVIAEASKRDEVPALVWALRYGPAEASACILDAFACFDFPQCRKQEDIVEALNLLLWVDSPSPRLRDALATGLREHLLLQAGLWKDETGKRVHTAVFLEEETEEEDAAEETELAYMLSAGLHNDSSDEDG
jgi:hypothetical protein